MEMLKWFAITLIVVVGVCYVANILLPDYWGLVGLGALLAMLPVSYHGGV